MHGREALEAAGRHAAAAFRVQGEWIHRRVEFLSFPSVSEPTIRRRISIDFTIPDLKPVPGSNRYYVPLSVLRKWPPVVNLDLRSDSGIPIPLLTSRQNAVIDAALLIALAEDVVGRTLDPDLRQALVQVAEGRGQAADDALFRALPPTGDLDQARTMLAADRLFVETVGGVRDQTILWLRIQGSPGDREIVKLAYDTEKEVHLNPFEMASFGTQGFNVKFQVPHIGNAGSYHLQFATPSPLAIVDSETVIRRVQSHFDDPQTAGVAVRCSAEDSYVERDGIKVFTEANGRRGRTYVAGERQGVLGEFWVTILADKRITKGAVLAAFLIAALVTLFRFNLEHIRVSLEAGVAVLLLVPALLSYLLVRPGEHAFVSGFLRGHRWLLLLSGAPPLAGAVGLVLTAGGDGVPACLCTLFGVLAVASWLVAVALFVTLVLPVGKAKHPLSARTG